jgi:hypothetical protein
MAIIILKDADVVKVMPGWGFKAQNTSTLTSGEQIVEKYTVWVKDFNPSMAPEGSVVNVRGKFGKKLEKFDNEQGQTIHYIDVHINDAELLPKVGQSPPDENSLPVAKVQEAAVMGQWPTATIGQATADAPF